MRPTHSPHPACIYLETLTEKRAELYAHVPLTGITIPIEMAPSPVDDNIQGEEENSEAVLQLRMHHVRGPSGMRVYHLRMWLCAATREEYPDLGNWEKVVAIIQAAFRGGELAAPSACQMVVMIPKWGGTDFRGIGLVEVL